MRTLSITVTNPNGLTSRYAAELVAEANKHLSNITLIADKEDPSLQADLKSIMNVFTISISQGQTFTIEIEGSDEDKAYNAFEELIKSTKYFLLLTSNFIRLLFGLIYQRVH